MVETPGRGPGGSRFESGRSHREGSGDQRGLIRPARGFDPRPRHQGRWRNPEAQLPCKEKVAGSNPARSTEATVPADVAQLEEARRSERRQCGFDSRRQYHLDVAQWERTGFGSRGLGVRVSPSRPRSDRCEVVELVPRLPLKQELRVRALASQPHDASAVVALLDSRIGLLRRWGFLHDLQVAGSSPAALLGA